MFMKKFMNLIVHYYPLHVYSPHGYVYNFYIISIYFYPITSPLAHRPMGSSHHPIGAQVLGSGCYRIGASVEFDWSSVSAVRTPGTLWGTLAGTSGGLKSVRVDVCNVINHP